jgi:hypothetical protein
MEREREREREREMEMMMMRTDISTRDSGSESESESKSESESESESRGGDSVTGMDVASEAEAEAEASARASVVAWRPHLRIQYIPLLSIVRERALFMFHTPARVLTTSEAEAEVLLTGIPFENLPDQGVYNAMSVVSDLRPPLPPLHMREPTEAARALLDAYMAADRHWVVRYWDKRQRTAVFRHLIDTSEGDTMTNSLKAPKPMNTALLEYACDTFVAPRV